jgi:thiol:disulfide interchange protein DsbD
VQWLVCREVCLPGKAYLGLDLLIAPGSPIGENKQIADALHAEPIALPPSAVVRVSGTRDHLFLDIATGQREQTAEFYPFEDDSIRNAGEQPVKTSSTGARLTVERADISDTLPSRLKGVVKLSGKRSYAIDLPVAVGVADPVKTTSVGLAPAILLAFVGGIVLNLMPCVFPVLFLKALALVDASGESNERQRRHGVVYTAGILCSFWIIVGVLLSLRAVGRQAGWGFQLQSPSFVVFMTCLLFFMALSLAGQFDIGIGLTSAGNNLARKRGYAGSFFTGVLATVVATPCTAPLMGAAVGFALSQSALVTFVVFTALALGLAIPYLLLTLNPGWVNKLPRPGRWMETLKQVTAVPLFLTVVWLAWVFGRLNGPGADDSSDHIARLLIALILLAVSGWILGRWPTRRWGYLAASAVAIGAIAIPLSSGQSDRLQWQPFSAAAIQEARTQGRPVFVDFTAAWCLSCQVNERAVLHDKSVERELATRHYVLLRADWTRYDPAITEALAHVGRSGIPTYVVYSGDSASEAKVLPELLTRDAVLTVLRKAGS